MLFRSRHAPRATPGLRQRRVDREPVPTRQDGGALDHVRELAYVAGPFVLLEPPHVARGEAKPTTLTITGHSDPSVFERYNVRRDAVQADALQQQERYLAGQRTSTPAVPTTTPRPS